MGYQSVPAVKIVPQGGRFQALNWQNGQAFGGWIYNFDLQIGFADKPTTITLDIAFDSQGATSTTSASFDINKDDLKACYSGVDNSYWIKIGSVSPQSGIRIYKFMYLVNYEISASGTSKNLRVTFSDYSLVLDKIIVNLFKKNGYPLLYLPPKKNNQTTIGPTHVKQLRLNPSLVTLCDDCNPSGTNLVLRTGNLSSFVESAAVFYNSAGAFDCLGAVGYNTSPTHASAPFQATIDLTVASNSLNFQNNSSYLSQVEINSFNTSATAFIGKTPSVPTLNFSGFMEKEYTSHTWPSKQYENDQLTAGFVSINGGTIIIGTEEFNETTCGSLAPVSYNFSELLLVLSKIGFGISKINESNSAYNYTLIKQIDKNPRYRQSYIGTLREVLNNWCADFALNFTMDGKRILFFDLSNPVRANAATLGEIMIPSNTHGQTLNSDKDHAISQFTQKASLEGTYSQSVITFDTRPKKKIQKSKSQKRRAGFIAMHPLDFMNPETATIQQISAYNITGQRPKYLNNIWPQSSLTNLNLGNPTSPAGQKKIWYTNRPIALIDICAALGKKSKTLRNIFAGNLLAFKIENGNFNDPACISYLNCFGVTPLFTITQKDHSDIKEDMIEDIYNKKSPDGQRQNYVIQSKNFSVLICMQDENDFSRILEWEGAVADHMYKVGIPTLSNSPTAPFVSADWLSSPGFFEEDYMAVKVQTQTQPSIERYKNLEDSPCNDFYKSSGAWQDNWSNIPLASLENSWGDNENTLDHLFSRLTANSTCNNFSDLNTVFTGNDNYSGDGASPASFDLRDFEPKIIDLSEDYMDTLLDEIRNSIDKNPVAAKLLGAIIRLKGPGANKFPEYRCSKLKLMIIPIVSTLTNYGTNYAWTEPSNLAFNDRVQCSPHLSISWGFTRGQNLEMTKSAGKKSLKFQKDIAAQFPKTLCDVDMASYVCDRASPCPQFSGIGGPHHEGFYYEGFERASGLFSARKIDVKFEINRGLAALSGADIVYGADGNMNIKSDDEEFPTHTIATLNYPIVYPLDTFYDGLITNNVETQITQSQVCNFVGSYWSGTGNILKTEQINNPVDQDNLKIIDSASTTANTFVKPIYDMQGNAFINISGYHNYISNIAARSNDQAALSTSYDFVGDVPPDLVDKLTIPSGLTSLSYSLGSEGFKTKVTMSTRPVKLPKREAIINRINSRR